MDRLESELMAILGRFQEYLKVAIGPFPNRTRGPDLSPGIENIPELDNEAIPLGVGETSVKGDGVTESEGKTQECLRADGRDIDSLGGASDGLRRKTHLTADCLQLSEREPRPGLLLGTYGFREFSGSAEDRRDLSLGVSAFGHG